MSLLTAKLVKEKQSYLDYNLLYLSRKRPKTKLKIFCYQILTP